MKMNSKHPKYKIKEFEFQPKISQDDIDYLKEMKKSKTIHDARYWLMKRYWDNKTQKLTVDPRTIESWLKKYFV